jgi:hypothetical protein
MMPWTSTLQDAEIDRLRNLCLRGLCGAFALELASRTQWPLAGLYAGPGAPVHVVCVDPDDGYADASGRNRSFESLCAEFDTPRRIFAMKAIAPEEIEFRFPRDPAWRRLIAKQLREIAPYLPK